jgi:hypothetical protein
MGTPISTLSDHFKYQRDNAVINLASDVIHVLLMRSGFPFGAGVHSKLINVKTASASIASLTIDNTAKTLTRGAGSFVTDGFVVGNMITTNSANAPNQGPFLISAVNVNGLVLTITTMAGGYPSLTGGTESAVTVTSNDEVPTGGGYTQDNTSLSGQAVAEDDVGNTSTMTCSNVSWLGSGSGFGPVAGALLYDYTSADKTIIGYINFNGDQTVAAAASLVLSGIAVQSA